ncbi:MAG: glycosyltransferase [Coriobacteriia bacterium]|nr:glycosyltransferase [Coriobacteriia bacterium]
MADHVVMVVTNPVVSDPRVEKEAAALVGAGYAVTVLAWDRAAEAPATEDRAGVRIERLGPTGPYGGGPKSLPLFREFWRRATARALEIGPAVMHCHDLDTASVGLAVVRRSAQPVRLVLDMHELYRDSKMVPQRGLVGFAARTVVRIVERRAFTTADVIVVANPGTVEYYGRLGFDAKVVVVENAPDHELFRPRAPGGSGGRIVVGYFGQKRYADGLLLLIDVVARRPRLGALLAGGGTGAEVVEKAAHGVESIEVSGRFSYTDLPDLYRRCDVVYAVYDVVLGNVRTLFPVKVMEAMACALPMIVASGTWAGEYVERHGLGLAVAAGDREALEAALDALMADPEEAAAMGRRGREIVEAGLNWESASARLLEMYARLDPPSPARGRSSG